MKKTLILSVLISLGVLLTSCGADGLISEDEAKKAALSHAQIDEAKAKFSKAKLESDDGKKQYEIEFYADGKEYDYEIDAKTGDVISFDYDIEDKLNLGENDKFDNDIPGESQVPVSNGVITKDDALAVALGEVSGATADDAYVREDYDDGKLYYDVTIIYDGKEYEFEIDASSGNITERDVDSLLFD